MPAWTDAPAFAGWEPRDDTDLRKETGIVLQRQKELDPVQLKVMHERFMMIAPSLPCIGDMRERASRIREATEAFAVTAQTVRDTCACSWRIWIYACWHRQDRHPHDR